MADPSPYVVTYSLSGFQAQNPTTPLPAPQVDNGLANIAAAVAGLISAMKDVRRSDGALKSGIVTLDSFAQGLQLTVDPTNGNLVAAAVATAQAAQAAAGGSATATSASNALTQALAAAASASSVNLSLFLAKANNLAGLGNNNTALANINAAKNDGTNLTGRLSKVAGPLVADWNAVLESGWSAGAAAANGPVSGDASWLVQTIAFSALYVTQIAYPFLEASVSTSAVTPYRRHSFDSGGGVRAWSRMGGRESCCGRVHNLG
jgi:hypothetical protein